MEICLKTDNLQLVNCFINHFRNDKKGRTDFLFAALANDCSTEVLEFILNTNVDVGAENEVLLYVRLWKYLNSLQRNTSRCCTKLQWRSQISSRAFLCLVLNFRRYVYCIRIVDWHENFNNRRRLRPADEFLPHSDTRPLARGNTDQHTKPGICIIMIYSQGDIPVPWDAHVPMGPPRFMGALVKNGNP